MSLAQAYENFVWRLETLTPTSALLGDRFRFVDPLRVDASLGASRSFYVRWLGSEEDAGPTDLYDRWAKHSFEVRISYRVGPDGMDLRDAMAVLLADRHDICERLRQPDYWPGYDASNTATDIKLQNRVRVDDASELDAQTLTYRSVWSCDVQEIE